MAHAFIDDDFLLHSNTARDLYRRYAAPQPILDYHSHLPAAEIAANRRFADLFDIWLEGDHYKWRAMRAHGVDERLCTGDAPPYEKFAAWASTVPSCLRNPLYHWTHLELLRYFGIDELLDPSTAPDIWEAAKARLQNPDRAVHGILSAFDVRVLCTTDDPTDTLEAHRAIAASGLATRVFPTFRPDRAFRIDQPEPFSTWLEKLSAASDVDIVRLSDFLEALEQRHQAFHDVGGRLSDHGLTFCFSDWCSESHAAAIFDKAMQQAAITDEERRQFGSFLMVFFGQLDAAKGWTKQLHLGAIRNVRSRAHARLGPDTGHDSIGDWDQIEALGSYLDRLDSDGALPQTIIYNVNPTENYAFATMAGNFQEGPNAGKVQFGSGWWFLDQREGIEWQLNALSNAGLLAHFVGMTTDSRSFMSFPRHEYFRRVLCNVIGAEVERGDLPDRDDLLGPFIENICYKNAARYFGLT